MKKFKLAPVTGTAVQPTKYEEENRRAMIVSVIGMGRLENFVDYLDQVKQNWSWHEMAEANDIEWRNAIRKRSGTLRSRREALKRAKANRDHVLNCLIYFFPLHRIRTALHQFETDYDRKILATILKARIGHPDCSQSPHFPRKIYLEK